MRNIILDFIILILEVLFNFTSDTIYKYYKLFKILFKKDFKFILTKKKYFCFIFFTFFTNIIKNKLYFQKLSLQKNFI